MPFSWLNKPVPAHAKSNSATAFLAMHRREIGERASLLRRLGYSRDEALRRCQAYELGEFEPFARSPLAAEVAKLVDEVYQPKTGRVMTLSPGI